MYAQEIEYMDKDEESYVLSTLMTRKMRAQ